MVFKACNKAAKDDYMWVKVTGVTTPNAQKTTGDFTFNIYKTFALASYTFDNEIMTGTTTIDSTYFTSGTMTSGKFSSSVGYIQIDASHLVEFTMINALPKKSTSQNSRIVIKMPTIMT